jgi:hypothetical protein
MEDTKTLDKVLKSVANRNYDNDIVALMSTLRRYKMETGRIDIGGSTFDGSVVEFLISLCKEIDEIERVNKIRFIDLQDQISELTKDKIILEHSQATEEIDPMQLSLDSLETPPTEEKEKVNPAPKKTSPRAKKAQ